MCVCSLRYPACNAHAPYCHLWPARLYSIFPHYLINGTIFGGGGVTEYKTCVLILSTNFVWNISHSKKNWARYGQKCISVFMWSACYFLQILIKPEFSRQIFGKYSNTKFQENPLIGSRVVPCGQTDRQTWRSQQSLFAKFANTPQNRKKQGKGGKK